MSRNPISVEVWIVRHGERIDETDQARAWYNATEKDRRFDPPLTDAGRAQARKASCTLRKLLARSSGEGSGEFSSFSSVPLFDTVYCSPMQRCLATAHELIAAPPPKPTPASKKTEPKTSWLKSSWLKFPTATPSSLSTAMRRVLCMAKPESSSVVEGVCKKEGYECVTVRTRREAAALLHTGGFHFFVAALGTDAANSLFNEGRGNRSDLITRAKQDGCLVVVFSNTAVRDPALGAACTDAGADGVVCSADALRAAMHKSALLTHAAAEAAEAATTTEGPTVPQPRPLARRVVVLPGIGECAAAAREARGGVRGLRWLAPAAMRSLCPEIASDGDCWAKEGPVTYEPAVAWAARKEVRAWRAARKANREAKSQAAAARAAAAADSGAQLDPAAASSPGGREEEEEEENSGESEGGVVRVLIVAHREGIRDLMRCHLRLPYCAIARFAAADPDGWPSPGGGGAEQKATRRTLKAALKAAEAEEAERRALVALSAWHEADEEEDGGGGGCVAMVDVGSDDDSSTDTDAGAEVTVRAKSGGGGDLGSGSGSDGDEDDFPVTYTLKDLVEPSRGVSVLPWD